MTEVLLVEDSRAIATLLRDKIEKTLQVKVRLASSLAETQDILANAEHHFFVP